MTDRKRQVVVPEPHNQEADMAARASRIVPFIAAGAMFMENLDSTVIVTALPAMALEFGSAPPVRALA